MAGHVFRIPLTMAPTTRAHPTVLPVALTDAEQVQVAIFSRLAVDVRMQHRGTLCLMVVSKSKNCDVSEAVRGETQWTDVRNSPAFGLHLRRRASRGSFHRGSVQSPLQ